ncbi:MAG: peptidoglycan DD-metalloendopeptidase family protein [Armatimonadota bacterium]|nr:peptidoglycan DD-metalloendopeptidase family protein [Armatimonadota bacterium]
MRLIPYKKHIALMVAFLTLCSCSGRLIGASGSQKTSLKSKLDKAKKIQAQIKVVRHKIRVKENEKRTVIGQLSLTEARLEAAQESLARNKLRLLDAQADLEATMKRLARTRKQLARRKALLARRVVDIYEGEDLGYLNVLLGATDMWTFLTRAYYIKRILDSDARLIAEIKADEAAIERDRQRQARRLAEIRGLHARLVAQRNEVANLVASKRQQLMAIEHSKELYERALDELLAQSQRIEEEIRRIQSTPAGRARYSRAFRGGLRLPVPGRITSTFGYRVHPITGVYKLHTGVDIACSSGTPICAAADGEVIIAGWQGAYGYTVVIDHGGGVSTLYGHCSRILVSVGEEVRKGQVIARVGSTGLSTGPHCHFEKRVNGKPVNPL